MRAFLGLGDSAVFHCMLCLFVSGSYRKTQASFPEIICLRISRLSLIFSGMSSQNLTRFCCWSSDKILGTILAHTFCIPRSLSKIVGTDSLFRLSLFDIIHTVNLRSLHTSCFTLADYTAKEPITKQLATKSWYKKASYKTDSTKKELGLQCS